MIVPKDVRVNGPAGWWDFKNSRPLALIAGPCSIEDLDHALKVARGIDVACRNLGVPWVYKSSFDKANRTSAFSPRGVGIEEGLRILAAVRDEIQCPILTDVHEPWQCEPVAKVVDVLQIPAFLCRQTDLLVAAAKTMIPVNVKKGQFLAPWDIQRVVEKIEQAGNTNVILTERGACFGYNTLVSDMRAIPEMAKTGCPVIFDATHSVQQPGGRGSSSGGQREYVAPLARAAVAVGVAGVFLEVHDDPDSAPSDGPNMLPIEDLEPLIEDLVGIDRVVKGY